MRKNATRIFAYRAASCRRYYLDNFSPGHSESLAVKDGGQRGFGGELT
jgi:hypothetical protein